MSCVELADEAAGYVRLMIKQESRGWGDQKPAQRRLETRYGIPFWSMEHLRSGEAKSCETSLFMRIKAAFIDHCGREAANLLHKAEVARKVNPDVDLENIENKIRALVAELEAAKSDAKARVAK